MTVNETVTNCHVLKKTSFYESNYKVCIVKELKIYYLFIYEKYKLRFVGIKVYVIGRNDYL